MLGTATNILLFHQVGIVPSFCPVSDRSDSVFYGIKSPFLACLQGVYAVVVETMKYLAV